MRPVLAVLTVAGWLTLAGTAAAQSDSHIPIKDWGGGGQHDPKALGQQLNERLKLRPKTQADGIEPEFAKQLAEMLQKDPEKWQDFFKQNPGLELAARAALNDPKRRDELRNQIKGLTNPSPRFPGDFPRNGVDQRLTDLAKRLAKTPSPATTGSPPNISMPNVAPNTPDAGPVPKPPDPSAGGSDPVPNSPRTQFEPKLRSAPRANDGRLMRDVANSIEKWFPKSMGDSPAMRKMLSNLEGKDWGKIADSTFGKTGKGPNINWNKVGNRLQGTGRFFDRNLPTVSGRRLPDLPSVSAPNLPRAPNLPTVGAPSGGDVAAAGNTFTVLLVIAAVLIGGFLAWRLIIRPLQMAKRGTSVETVIGPWPVDPMNVRTREELVKAFDYLALRTCGTPARRWHHREVASRLGAKDDFRRQTAANLAETYAHARYAPPAEPLDEPTAARARHDLCALAGEAVL